MSHWSQPYQIFILKDTRTVFRLVVYLVIVQVCTYGHCNWKITEEKMYLKSFEIHGVGKGSIDVQVV